MEVWKLGCLEVWFLCTTIVLSRACRALCFLFSVAVEGLALWACTLCSLGRASAPSPAGAWGSAPHLPIIPFLQSPKTFVSFVILCTLCGKNTLAVLRALARRPSLCLSVFSVVSVFFVICGSPASCLAVEGLSLRACTVYLCGPSCSSCQPRRANLPHFPTAPARRALAARSVLRSLWPWKVWRFAPARSVLRGGGNAAATPFSFFFEIWYHY